MFANFESASIYLSPIFGNGAAGAGTLSTLIKLVAAMVAFSANDLYGILQLCGKKSTVLLMCVYAVLFTCSLWHQ